MFKIIMWMSTLDFHQESIRSQCEAMVNWNGLLTQWGLYACQHQHAIIYHYEKKHFVVGSHIHDFLSYCVSFYKWGCIHIIWYILNSENLIFDSNKGETLNIKIIYC